MKLGSEYCKQLREALRRHANFPPNRPVSLGDYGVIQDNVFERLGHIKEFGLTVETLVGVGESDFQFQSQGSVDFELIAKGDIQPGGIPAVKAGLALKFSREQASFFAVAGCTVQSMGNIRQLEGSLIDLLRDGRWEADFYVVTEVNLAAKTTLIISATRDSEVRLEASSPALETIEMGDASLNLGIKKSRNASFQIATKGGQIPMMQLSRLRGLFHNEFRPASAIGGFDSTFPGTFSLTPDPDTATPGEAEELILGASLDVAPLGALGLAPAVPGAEPESARFLSALSAVGSSFDVQRALDLHLPLLAASYALAGGEPNPALPPGVVELSRIMASIEIGAISTADALSPEAERSLENDLRALDVPPVPGAAIGAANPDAFGFIVRETDTPLAHVVCIRGTMTPEEWVRDFQAIANPFNEVPGFGFVHLGFEVMWRRIRVSVVESLKNIPNGSRITFVGHSLGGAMALLGAADVAVNMARTRGWVVDAFTVGCPRPGGVRFRTNFNRVIPNYFRITNQGDVVPHVPPLLLPPLFNHPGKEVGVVGRNGNPHSLKAYTNGIGNLAGGVGAIAPGPITGARTV
ncbi:MAG: lipase family protein [Bryobacteraceae bacterium]|nr:lipase family protein [Bryobacteraceae bacterium]